MNLGTLPGGAEAYIDAISGDGLVVAGTGANASGNDEAFVWTQAGTVGLGALPGGVSSRANGVSFDGSVVVGTSPNGDDYYDEAFVWTQAGMVGLGTLGGGRAGQPPSRSMARSSWEPAKTHQMRRLLSGRSRLV